MFTVSADTVNVILRDYGIGGRCTSVVELRRYHYEKNDPSSKEVRLIVRVGTDSGRELVIRFRNEKGVTPGLVNDQSRFAALLAENGIETPRVRSRGGQYAIPYRIGGYEVIVTVEDFVSGEVREVDAETAEKAGRLLARMHGIAEAQGCHIQNEILFDPLKRNDLFSFEDFIVHRDHLAALDGALFHEIVQRHAVLLRNIRRFENEPRFAVQGDLSVGNLYRTAVGELGVFDFNRCGDSVPYFDAVMQAVFVARLMDYPEELAEDPEKVILPAFLKGYHRERPFTAEQREVFPSLYALISAFRLTDLKWGEQSLLNAVERADPDAALRRMREIRDRLTYLPPMPV